MRKPSHIEFWDDERNMDNGIIVTLKYGWSFEHSCHEGVRGFDTVSEAREGTKKENVYICECAECKEKTKIKTRRH